MWKVQQPDGSIHYPVLILKWLVFCSSNAIFSFLMAFSVEYAKRYDVISMLLGVLTFVLLYAYIEMGMVKNQHVTRRKIMLVGVIIHIPLQFIPVADLFLGILSITIIKKLPISYPFDVYAITLVQGVFLSIICFILGSIFYWSYIYIQKYRLNKQKSSL